MTRVIGLLLTLGSAAIVSGAQAPAAPAYDVRVELDQPSTGTATFTVDSGGKVTGMLHVEAPNVVTATLSGTVKDGVWTFEFPYAMPAQNCEGVAKGTARVPLDRRTISGTLVVGGACVDPPLTGTFSFTARGVSPVPSSTVVLPDTPQGQRVAAYVRAFNAGETEYLLMYREQFTRGMTASVTDAARSAQYASLTRDIRPLVVDRVVRSTAQRIVFSARRRNGETATFSFAFEPAAPFRIAGLDIAR